MTERGWSPATSRCKENINCLFYLDKLAPVSNDLLSGSGLEPLVAAWDLLALHPHPGYDVAFQHSHQLLLVAHQLVQGVNGNLR